MNSARNESRIIVDLVKVSKTYHPDIHAVVDVSLSVNRGEILFLTGRSGAGKTTILHLLNRIESPDKGLVEVAGQDLGKLSQGKMQKLRRSIGVAYQDFKLLPNRSVAQNIAIAMEVTYTRPSTIRTRTRDILQRLGLADKYHTPTAELSRGEQQRVAIARAVAGRPQLILTDEPTGNLDHETTTLVMDLLSHCNKKGATIIIATHDESIYRQTEHRVIELRAGRIVNGNPVPDDSRWHDPATTEETDNADT